MHPAAEFWCRFWLAWFEMAWPYPRRVYVEHTGDCQVAHCQNWRRTTEIIEERKQQA